ncbi:MAG: histidine kinase, partial [Gammaproteobacteria bacterium]|nr:histidine kinase [Gammaproteobacteria bacterium]
VGLLLAGIIVLNDAMFFFSRGSIVLPLFFGGLGFVIFGTRERLNQIRTQLAQTEALKLAEEKQHTETQLRLLQAQIEPHFLFNTLSNIAGMIETNPKEAEATLVNLTTLLRSSLKRTRKEIVTLADELEIVRAYLEIQRTRMQDRLQYHINLEPTLESLPLPPLLLQPLVENAIKHGIDPLEKGGDITVDIRRNGSAAQITVTDTGHGIDPTGATAGEGTGLKNIRDRLNALYAGEASLLITDNQPQGIIATLTLPIANDDNSTAG